MSNICTFPVHFDPKILIKIPKISINIYKNQIGEIIKLKQKRSIFKKYKLSPALFVNSINYQLFKTSLTTKVVILDFFPKTVEINVLIIPIVQLEKLWHYMCGSISHFNIIKKSN